jgi:hypothetical protein
MRYWLLFALMTLSLSGFAQTREQVEGEVDIEGVPSVLPDNNQEGDLNTNTQVGGNNTSGSYNTNKTYNGAGSSGMPVNTAISPSLMSNGSESCLQSTTGGLQLIGVGVSSGKYTQDVECNRRRDAITLSNMGMKVAAVSLMCQNPNVWRAMFMSATPCPIVRSGKLVVGKNALLEIKQNPELHIPAYSDYKDFYDAVLGVGIDETTEVESTVSVSDRFRTSTRQ